jgi:uncharacterized repeat protein (TIGR04076 family)
MPDYRCKITVLRRTFNQDFYDQYPVRHAGPCDSLSDGQEFLTEIPWAPPEGLCTWAWADMRSLIHAIHAGSPVVKVFSCSDGLRPVFFKLERVDG